MSAQLSGIALGPWFPIGARTECPLSCATAHCGWGIWGCSGHEARSGGGRSILAIELRGDDITSIAIVMGQGICTHARPNEVLASTASRAPHPITAGFSRDRARTRALMRLPRKEHERREVDVLVERATGIEPAFSAWEADVLPLNYTRAGERG